MKRFSNSYSLLILAICLNTHLAGQTYWQQEVNYRINVSLNDIDHTLDGYVSITYINHSPYSIDSIFMHLWPNAYKNYNTAFAKQQLENNSTDFYYANKEDRAYIDDINFTVNADKASWHTWQGNPDIAVLELNKPLEPEGKIIIETPFHVKIPKTFSRMGHDGQAYQISQWYPKPAVFDMKGWHPIPYLDQGEFYSEFGDYEVAITLPANYIVAASGDLQDSSEIYFLREQAALSTIALKDSAPKAFDDSFPPSASEMKTLHYTLKHAHDFAWFADKRWMVSHEDAILPSDRKVDAWAMFLPDDAAIWKHAVHTVVNTLQLYSAWVGDYQWNQATAVEGALGAGGGMEYPTVTVISGANSVDGLQDVVAHEVGHNWFYGMLGFNERDYPWMDEGINSFYEQRFMALMTPSSGEKSNRKGINISLGSNSKFLMNLANQQQDITGGSQVLGDPAENFTKINYGIIVYGRTPILFTLLEQYLGQTKYDLAMQDFFRQWHGKHPQPEDFKSSFEKSTGEDINWFFDLINKKERTDIAIADVDQSPKAPGIVVHLKNKGKTKVPVPIQVMQGDSVLATHWVPPFSGETSYFLPLESGADKIWVDRDRVLIDVRRNNQIYKLKGLHKFEKPKFKWGIGLDADDRSEIFFTPIVGWNKYDKWMPGLAIYNSIVPSRNLEFELAPMWSFQNQFSGMGRITKYWYPLQGTFNQFDVGIEGFQFKNDSVPFKKLSATIHAGFRPADARTGWQSDLKYRAILSSFSPVILDTTLADPPHHKYYHELSYTLSRKRVLSDYSLSSVNLFSNDFGRASVEANMNFLIRSLKKKINVRLFAGTFLYNNLNFIDKDLFGFNMSGIPGSKDFLFDHIYFGRNAFSGFLYQQMYNREGAFKVRTDKFPFGSSSKWLASLNLRIPLPKIPVQFYTDFGTYAGAGKANTNPIMAEAGLVLAPIPDYLEIYFPLPFLMSSDIKQAYLAGTTNYWQRITFMINFNKLDPFKVIRNLKL